MRVDFSTVPCWYVRLGIWLMAYGAVRGYIWQWTIVKAEQRDLRGWRWLFEGVIYRYVQGALYYAVCSAAGVIALWSVFVALSQVQLDGLSGPSSALIAFLSVLGILGAGGQLPEPLLGVGGLAFHLWLRILKKFGLVPEAPTSDGGGADS